MSAAGPQGPDQDHLRQPDRQRPAAVCANAFVANLRAAVGSHSFDLQHLKLRSKDLVGIILVGRLGVGELRGSSQEKQKCGGGARDQEK